MKKSKLLVRLCIAIAMVAALAMPAIAADSESKVLIKNVNIFNGTSENLITWKDIVLVGNKIGKVYKNTL